MGSIFIAIVGMAAVLIVLDVVSRRRRGAQLAWAIGAIVVLVVGGAVQAVDHSGPWPVITLVLGAICITFADRGQDHHA